jgi:hypothetical protein
VIRTWEATITVEVARAMKVRVVEASS